MRLPFLTKAAKIELPPPGNQFNISLKTPQYEYTPSDTLQLVIHLPANGFIHLRPPHNIPSGSDTPGQYDHILNGVLEVIAPLDWRDTVESISVGYRVSYKLNLGKGREEEVDTLFDRHVTLDEGTAISPGSQTFTFSLILPCSLPAHDYHYSPLNIITHKAYAELISSSTTPPSPKPSTVNYFARDNVMVPTEIAVTPLDDGVYRVIYGGNIRARVCHMTEDDGGIVTLDHRKRGVVEGMGVYDYNVLSDIWSISGPFQVEIRLPSLSPLTTVFYTRMFITQTPSVRSPKQSPDTPSSSYTTKFTLAEFGEKPPPGHVHPARHTKALWKGLDAGGKGGGNGWDGQAFGRLPDDQTLRASTVDGVTTPIEVKHTLCLEVFFSVYGQLVDGTSMKPPGPGALRIFRRTDGIILPACVNIPNMLQLPTYEESSCDQGEGQCACRLPVSDVMSRMKKYVDGLKREDIERAAAAKIKDGAASEGQE